MSLLEGNCIDSRNVGVVSPPRIKKFRKNEIARRRMDNNMEKYADVSTFSNLFTWMMR
jgi:hypothetical protein